MEQWQIGRRAPALSRTNTDRLQINYASSHNDPIILLALISQYGEALHNCLRDQLLRMNAQVTTRLPVLLP